MASRRKTKEGRATVAVAPAWLTAKRIAWLLGLVTLAVYLRVSGFAFLSYDDAVYVTDNPHVLRGLAPSSVAWAFTATEGSNYWHPLTWLSHMLDVDLYGMRSGGHHVTSALLHAVNTGLLFWVLCGLCGVAGGPGSRGGLVSGTGPRERGPYRTEDAGMDVTGRWPGQRGGFFVPALVAALFGLHPLHVESVAWVAERKDVLSGLFWILAMGAYVRYARVRQATRNVEDADPPAAVTGYQSQVTKWYLLTLVCFACSLMSKPMAVTLPLVLLILDWWPLGRFGWPATGWSASGRKLAAGAWGGGVPVGGADSGRGADVTLQQAGLAEPTGPRERGPYRGTARPGVAVTRFTCACGLLLEKLPFFLLAAVMSYWVFHTQAAGGALAAGVAIPLPYRIANAAVSYVAYLGQTAWPTKLAFFYPHPEADLSFMAAGAAGVLLAVVTGVAWWQRRQRPWLLAGWLWYVITLLPVSGIIQIGSFARADRYTYLPLIGIFWMAAVGVQTVASRRADPARGEAPRAVAGVSGYGLLVSGLLLTFLAALTWRQLGYWKDGFTLATRALAVTRENTMAMNCLGEEFLLAGRGAEAMAQFRRALAINPNLAQSHYNLGLALLHDDQAAEAMPHFLEALRIQPGLPKAHYNLGVYLGQEGRLPEAAAHYRAELLVNPTFARAHNNLANVLLQQGANAEALASYRDALRLDPGLSEARANMGMALQNLGRLPEAIEAYSEALRLAPGIAGVQGELGKLLARAGQRELALAHLTEALRERPGDASLRFTLAGLQAEVGQTEAAVHSLEEAVRLDPQGADALINLAWIRATCIDKPQRDGAAAVQIAREALARVGTNDPPALDALAAAYAESGDFTQAVAVAEQVVALAAAMGAGGTSGEVAQRLELYRQGKPFRSSRPLLQ